MREQYWFPAKRYGWGWGLPSSWQGWVVFVGFLALVALGSVLFPPGSHAGWYIGYTLILSGAFVAIAWWKGEPTRWRWGGD